MNAIAASLVASTTVITVVTLAATRLARTSRASVRHLLLSAMFAMLLVLPIATILAPPVRIAVPIALGPLGLMTPPPLTTVTNELVNTDARASSTGAVSRGSSFAPVFTASFPALLFTLWAVGAVVCALPAVIGVWRVPSFHRSARPCERGQSIATVLSNESGIRRRVDVVRQASVSGPMTYGVIRPVIVLPIDAEDWTNEDLQRAIVHELEHVRRGDWITQSMARIVAAGYWFHPLVWLAWQQLALEAERACDDAVVRRSEPTAYAAQLVALAQRIVDSGPRSQLAMANRRHLPVRVAALLDSRQRRGRAGGRWITVACVMSVVLVASMSPLRMVPTLQAQTDAAPQRFDVASVKACKQELLGSSGQRRAEYVVTPGRVTVACTTTERLIHLAYAGIGSLSHPLLNSHPADSTHIRGGPGWTRADTFTIEARAEGVSDRTVMMGPMLRALLEERFQLRIHREIEEAPLYALRVAKGGLKMEPLGDGGCLSPDLAQDGPRGAVAALGQDTKPVCGMFSSVGNGAKRVWSLGGESMEDFARTLSGVLSRYVVDETGAAGTFNIHLEFGPDESVRVGVFGGRPVTPPAPGVEMGPSIFTALEEQLGLKIENTRGQREFLAIESVQRPIPD